MIISDNGLQFLKLLEQFRSKAYWDNNGYAIGYGSHYHINGNEVRQGDTVTEPIAAAMMLVHLQEIEKYLSFYKLEQNQFDALCSLVYNIGLQAFKNSTINKMLIKDEEIIKDYWMRWNKITKNGKKIISQSLVRRREKEWNLFKHYVYNT